MQKSMKLTTDKWSHIIRAVRKETGHDFQISMKEMEIIIIEGNKNDD